jgi:hypothetical protein
VSKIAFSIISSIHNRFSTTINALLLLEISSITFSDLSCCDFDYDLVRIIFAMCLIFLLCMLYDRTFLLFQNSFLHNVLLILTCNLLLINFFD